MVVWEPKVHEATPETLEILVPLAQLGAMVSRATDPILAQLAILAILVERDKQAKLDT
jgi:hypothetical protein